MIQIVKLRGGREFFNPAITAPSVQELFENIDDYVAQIPEVERFNIYYMACEANIGSHEFIRQNVIPFDIDDIDISKKGIYIEVVSAIIGIPTNELGCVFSGNGIQIIVGLKNFFEDKKYFDEMRPHYIAICKQISARIKELGLPGRADTSVWSSSRLLRLPKTKNVKPDKPKRDAVMMNPSIHLNGFDLEAISGLGKISLEIHKPIDGSKFPSPDSDAIESGCNFLKFMKNNKNQTEPQWYSMLSIVGRLDNGFEKAHEYSKNYIGYSRNETSKKITQALSKAGPSTCSSISGLWNGCESCEFNGKIKSPISIKSKNIDNRKNKILETEVVNQMIDFFGENIVRDGSDLFRYEKGVWIHFKRNEIMNLQNDFYTLFKSEATHLKSKSALNAFINKVPASNGSMFTPDPYCINFLDGTLHVIKNSDRTWNKIFKPHSKSDCLVNQLPYNYDVEDFRVNDAFNDFLNRCFKSDYDKDQKILAIKQMYGACLLPAFPRLFMIHGESGRGKTTIIQIISQLLKEDNISRVEPSDFKGFNMALMAGKLVNIVTDIDTNRPISDANVKKIEDRVPVFIDRKGIEGIFAPLPAIHIFGANELPPTLEGGSRAHGRRWTFLEFKSLEIDGVQDKSYAQWIFDQCPEGILNFAIEGVDSLLEASGHFINPDSGKERIEQWMEASDVVGLFLNDARRGEVKSVYGNEFLMHDTNGSIEKKQLYEIFKNWYEESIGSKFNAMSKHRFYLELRVKKYHDTKRQGYFFLNGLRTGALLCP